MLRYRKRQLQLNPAACCRKTIHGLEAELEQAQQAFVERSRALEGSRQELEQLCFDRATGDVDVSNATKDSLKALQTSLDHRAQALANARDAELKALRKAWQLQAQLLAAGEGSDETEGLLAEVDADVNVERARLKVGPINDAGVFENACMHVCMQWSTYGCCTPSHSVFPFSNK